MSNRVRYQSFGRRGFTLIEVLVVVAIIALLLTVLLPTLSKVREQGRRSVCLAQLKQILTATGMYMDAHRGMIPLGPAENISELKRDGQTYRIMLGNCMWGGRTGTVHYGEDYRDRPLTRFLYSNMPSEPDLDLFECPSDKGTPFWDDPAVPDAKRSLYTVCGNSYYMNTHGTLEREKEQSSVPPSRRILYEEGNMHWLLGNPPAHLGWSVVRTEPQQGRGWHGKWSRFNVAFLDLHVANMYIDTRNTSGPGWTVTELLSIWSWRVD